MRAMIVGAGAMGRWFADLTHDWLELSFADADAASAEAAARVYDGTVVDVEGDDRVDVVCTAVPMATTPEVIARVAPRAGRACIDLSGSMAAPLDAMRDHTTDCERISLHPLFAPENAPGNVPMVVEDGARVASELSTHLERSGYAVVDTTPGEHDRAMENVQAKAHVAVLAYALAAEPIDEAFHTPVSARLAELMELVLSGAPHVYGDVQERYPGASSLADAAERVAAADADTFEELYREAGDRHSIRDE